MAAKKKTILGLKTAFIWRIVGIGRVNRSKIVLGSKEKTKIICISSEVFPVCNHFFFFFFF